jgi:flagellar hook-associated protein 2
MASLSSPGIGSGLDVSGLVNKLVTAARTPQQNQIDARRGEVKSELSGLGTLKSALASLRDALAGLGDGSSFSKFLATASSTDRFNASADSTAAAGSYSIAVEQLAVAEKASSGAFAGDATLGAGSLTINVGGKSLTLAVGSGTNTLAQVAGAINRSSQNPGVTASVVRAADGDHLVFTSSKTGAQNAFTVSGSGSVAGLAYDPAHGVTGLGTVTSAADAKLSVDGFEITSASNAVQGAIQGVTLNLTAVSGGKPPDTLTIKADTDSIKNAVQAFVTSYNKFVSATKSLTSYDSASGTSGALLGDSTMLGITSRIAQAFGAKVGADGDAVRSLADIGLGFQLDGTLSVNNDKLSAALAATPGQVRNLFGNASGYGSRLTPMLAGYLQSGGILDSRTDSLNKNNKSLDSAQSRLDARMDALTTMYTTQFSKLDQLLTSLNSTSSFLTRQLAATSGSK